MPTSEPLDTGHWCEGCGWFETNVVFENGHCVVCGCGANVHVMAEVVPA